MAKRAPENLRIKRRYLVWLREAKGLSSASVDRAAASIDRYETLTRGADFRQFHEEKARAFKLALSRERAASTDRPLSASTLDGALRDLKAFFTWLADQPGYRSRIRRSDAAYLSPSRRTAAAAHGATWRARPTPEQVAHAIALMPTATVVERRDRAMLAVLYLTGARDGSLITLRLQNVDTAAGCVHFRGADVETKFGKVFTVWFFPVAVTIRRIALDWIAELRRDHLFGPADPMFPRGRTRIGVDGAFRADGIEKEPYASAARVVAVCKAAFTNAGLPPFTPHLLRKTLVDLANEHCATPEAFKAWSQNLAHEDVLTTFRSYGAVSPGRQRELIARMTVQDADVPLLFDPD